MENSEKQIVSIEHIIQNKFGADAYNLYLMDKGLVLINKTSRTVWTAPLILTPLLTGYNWSRKQEKIKNLKLDEILQEDKKSYAIAYEDIEQIRLHDPQSRWKSFSLEIKSPKIQISFLLNKTQFQQLSNVLPNLIALQGKLVK